jgi:hypothetical protein
MKCPKCGYNSFEFHDSCKKCANDLTGYKETYGLKPIVLPIEARTSMAAALMAETALSDHSPDVSVEPVDMFSFDLPEEEASPPTASDPFNFGDEPVSPSQTGGEFSFDEGQQSAQAKAEEDAFEDLLESTSQKNKAPLAVPPPAPASAVAADSTDTLDLNNFSWDDTPSAAADSSTKPAEDDFDTLFGDTDEPAKK